MISQEFGQPLEEVGAWSWRKRELYAHAIAAYNEFQKDVAEAQREGGDATSYFGGGGPGGDDVHPSLRKYENVAHVNNDPDADTAD